MEVNEELIKSWTDRINNWTDHGVTGKYILEMTDAVKDLEFFLSELKKILIKLEPREILSQFPSVPKLLHTLLNNILVQTTEEVYRLVLHCVAAVAVSSQSQHNDEINKKSIKWVKSQISSVCSSYPDIVSSSCSLAEQLGLQPVDITEHFNNELVSSFVDDLSNTSCREWSDLHRQFIPKFPIKGSTLRSISEMCLPILTKPTVRPLVEALLCCEIATDVTTNRNPSSAHVTGEEALSPQFLRALKDNPKECYNSLSQVSVLVYPDLLSYDARVSLWMKDHLYFEEEIICLLEICCFERRFMSREEIKKIVLLRKLPNALSENTSLFSVAYEILQRLIYETSGNLYVIKFVGVIFQLLSDVQRQKNENELVDTFNINFGNIWGVPFANLVNLLTVDCADMPSNSFLHHIKRVEHCINEINKGTSPGYHGYYTWLVLQGFPDLLQRCYWVVLVYGEQFVETCLEILLWHHGGGIKFADSKKIQLRHFVDTLRQLRNKSQVMTSDMLCALDVITDMTDSQTNDKIFMRYLVTLFMLISCSADSLDFLQIFAALADDLAVPDAFHQLLAVVEDTLRFQSNARWLSTNDELKTFTGNSLKILNAAKTKFDEHFSQRSQISMQDRSLEMHTASEINDLRSRFENLCQLLRKERG